MTWGDRFVRSLRRQGVRVVCTRGWRTRGRASWLHGNKPTLLFWHHTAGAATSSRDPNHPGNKGARDGRPSANAGVIAWVQHPQSDWPWANASLDRDGTFYLHSERSCWHSGEGTFRGTRWAKFRIPDNAAHLAAFGIEVVSKGLEKDWTAAQWRTHDAVAVAFREATGRRGWRWITDHKSWAPWRKTDVLYPVDLLVERSRDAWRSRGKKG